MGVNHGSFDIFVAEQFLDSANVVAVLEQVGGEGVPESMRGNAFFDFGGARGSANSFLQGGFMGVMTPGDASLLIRIKSGCRKNVLPNPFLVSVGIFLIQTIRQKN